MRGRDTVKRNRHYRCLEYDHNQSGDLCLIACGMERCDPGVNYGPEPRDGYHLHVVLSGTGALYAGGQVFHPHFGQLFILKDGEVVQYTADASDPWEYCWVTYNGSEARRLTEEIGFTEGVYCLDSGVEAKAFFELIRRMHETPEMNFIYDLRRRGILMEFISLALEATQSGSGKSARRFDYPTQVYIDRAVSFIQYNYATIRVSDVAEYVGYTRSYFTATFKAYTGLSPQEYLMQHRIKRACQLLAATQLSVGRIAADVGYENQLTFSRLFKNATGVSPTEYRRQKQASPGEETP